MHNGFLQSYALSLVQERWEKEEKTTTFSQSGALDANPAPQDPKAPMVHLASLVPPDTLASLARMVILARGDILDSLDNLVHLAPQDKMVRWSLSKGEGLRG